MHALILLFGLMMQEPGDAAQERDRMARDIEAIRPAKHAWRKIPWMSCPLEALRESRKEEKPILVWVFLGDPSDERC